MFRLTAAQRDFGPLPLVNATVISGTWDVTEFGKFRPRLNPSEIYVERLISKRALCDRGNPVSIVDAK